MTRDDKAGVRCRLDGAGAHWQRAPGSRADEALVEYAFVADADGATYVLLRDAGAPEGPVQVFTPSEWAAFVGGLADGDFDEQY